MTATLTEKPADPPAHPALTTGAPRRHALRELSRPLQALAYITPNWFAAVMGTGIVAVAASSLPVRLPGLHTLALAMWSLACVLLVALTALTALHWLRHPEVARTHHRDPVMAHFYGAPPMALLTVGAGALLVGRDLVGLPAALAIDWILWSAGTLAGLVSATAIPVLQFTGTGTTLRSAFGGWLMPIVPPMVSASTGALLVPHVAAGQPRLTLLLACYAMFGLALIPSAVVITLIWFRLVVHGIGEARMVPTLWIVLGPLGQSVTAANLLGGVAGRAHYADTLQAFGVVYGVPVFGFAILWLCLAASLTLRTGRAGLPFSLTWWSFTFPLATVVTATSALAAHTGSEALRWVATVLFVALLGAWATVALRTAQGAYRGTVFLPPVRAGGHEQLDGEKS